MHLQRIRYIKSWSELNETFLHLQINKHIKYTTILLTNVILHGVSNFLYEENILLLIPKTHVTLLSCFFSLVAAISEEISFGSMRFWRAVTKPFHVCPSYKNSNNNYAVWYRFQEILMIFRENNYKCCVNTFCARFLAQKNGVTCISLNIKGTPVTLMYF